MRILKTAAGILAASSLLALGAAGTAGANTTVKPAATPACGNSCFQLSSLQLGTSEIQNGYVPGNTGVGAKAGQKVNLHFATNTQVNADFEGAQVGTLGAFCAKSGGNGMLAATSYACTTLLGHEIITGVYSNDAYPVFESDLAPFGNQDGLCVGAVVPVFSGENATLQECGTSASTLWVGDLANGTVRHGRLYFPWIDGADTNFSHPLTLQVDSGSKAPQNQLKLANLSTLQGDVSPDSQEFTIRTGAVK